MIILYIIMILIAVLPLWKTIRFIRLEERIRREGLSTTGTVLHIHTTRYQRGPATDRVHARYQTVTSGRYHEANFVTKYRKYQVGQIISLKYIPEQPDRIVVAQRRGYWLMLIFSMVLLLFVIFAVYKINELVQAEGQTYTFNPPWKDKEE